MGQEKDYSGLEHKWNLKEGIGIAKKQETREDRRIATYVFYIKDDGKKEQNGPDGEKRKCKGS